MLTAAAVIFLFSHLNFLARTDFAASAAADAAAVFLQRPDQKGQKVLRSNHYAVVILREQQFCKRGRSFFYCFGRFLRLFQPEPPSYAWLFGDIPQKRCFSNLTGVWTSAFRLLQHFRRSIDAPPGNGNPSGAVQTMDHNHHTQSSFGSVVAGLSHAPLRQR